MAERNAPPDIRHGKTRRVKIESIDGGTFSMHYTINRDELGNIVELWTSIGHGGSTLQSMLDGWAATICMALQYGTPIEAIIDKFTGQQFPPYGNTTDPRIPKCNSLYDYLVQALALEWVEGLTPNQTEETVEVPSVESSTP